MTDAGPRGTLFEACRWGTSESLSSFSLREISRETNTLLWAAANPDSSCLELILKRCLRNLRLFGYQQSLCRDTPLHVATAANLPRNIELILQHKAAEVNDRADMGRTALHTAFALKHCEAASCLLRHGADPTVADNNEVSPLHSLLKPRGLDKTLEKVLLDNTGDIYIPALASVAAEVGTPTAFLRVWRTYKLENAAKLFEDALVKCNKKVAIAMLENDLFPDVDVSVLDDREPLLLACVIYGNDKAAKLLVQKGASDICNKRGRNAVQVAVSCDNLELLTFFLDHRFSTTTMECSAAQIAVNLFHISCLRVLLNHGVAISGLCVRATLPAIKALLVASGFSKSHPDMSESDDDDEDVKERHFCKTLQDLCRETMCEFVAHQGTNMFFWVKKMNLPSGLAKLLLLGESLDA